MDFPKFLTTNRRTREDRTRSEGGVFLVERREHPRHILELPINYSDADGKEHWGIAADASEGGVSVYLPDVIEKGSLLKIEMFFPMGSELNKIKAMAEVVWSGPVAKKGWGKYRYGLAFQAFREGSLAKLKILLKETAESQSE